MFYSEAILSRRGPLAKVWLAAHMERKLSKAQTLQTDIEQSVDAIMDQEVEVMALRLSGQLLLGVVRIYSRKAKYLLDDCNEALLKIKMAFKPGLVDMTEDQLTINRNAITLRAGTADLDVLLPDYNWDIGFDEDRIVQPQGHHVARAADITLTTGADDMQYDFDEAGYGDLGPADGIGSQDYDVDLGLDFGDGPLSTHDTLSIEGRGRDMDDSSSVEIGRDAHAPRAARESLGSHLMGRGGDADLDLLSHRSRQLSEDPFGADMAMDIDFGPDLGVDVDLGLTFDDQPLSEGQKTPGQTRSLSRASSPLSEAPRTPPPPGVESTAEIAAGEGTPPQQADAQAEESAKRKRREKKQIIDDQTELENGRKRGGFGPALKTDVSAITTQNHYLPRSSVVMQLLDIRQDPIAHFLPTKTTANGTFFCAGPLDLAPELQEMFMRPAPVRLPGGKRRGTSPEKPPSSKRARVEGDGAGDVTIDPVEQHRRADSAAPSAMLGSELLGRGGSVGPSADMGGLDFDTAPGLDDFQMDIPDAEMPSLGGNAGFDRGRSKSVARSELSRLSTPFGDEGEETYADLECPIAVFDMKGQSQASETPSASSQDGKGYSKNTMKALGLVRGELQPSDEDDEDVEKIMSFKKMTHKATRRAAASFFFELLVLGTRDCVKLDQRAPYENIHVRAKDKLWERQRHGSVAASELGSSFGL